MTTTERKKWMKTLGLSDSRVEVNKASIRSFGTLRPNVREGSASGRVEIPETIPASETTLGRMSNALSGVSSLFAQYQDFLFKKDEIAQRGKALKHQSILEQLKQQQIAASASQAGIRRQGIDERIIQQEIKNQQIEIQTFDIKQNNILQRLTGAELLEVSTQWKDEQEKQGKEIEKASVNFDKFLGSPDITADPRGEARFARMAGARTAELYKDDAAKAHKELLDDIHSNEIPPLVGEDSLNKATGLIDASVTEWMFEKKIEPTSEAGKGFLAAVQAFNLNKRGEWAGEIVEMSKAVVNRDTALGFSSFDPAPEAVQFDLPSTLTTTPEGDAIPIAPEATRKAFFDILGDLDAEQESALDRQLRREEPGFSLQDILLEMSTPGALQAEGATGAEVERALSLALQIVGAGPKGPVPDITETTGFKNNFIGRNQKTQQQILAAFGENAIAGGEASIQLAQLTMRSLLAEVTWDKTNGLEHPLGELLMTKLSDALQVTVDQEAKKLQLLRAEVDVLFTEGSQWIALHKPASSIRDLRALVLLDKSGDKLDEFRTGFTDLATNPDGTAWLGLQDFLDKSAVAYAKDPLAHQAAVLESLVNDENNQAQLRTEFVESQSWYRDPTVNITITATALKLHDSLEEGNPAKKWLERLLKAGQPTIGGTRISLFQVDSLTGDGLGLISPLVSKYRKDEDKLVEDEFDSGKRGDTLEESIRERMVDLVKSIPERLLKLAEDATAIEQAEADVWLAKQGALEEYFSKLKTSRESKNLAAAMEFNHRWRGMWSGDPGNVPTTNNTVSTFDGAAIHHGLPWDGPVDDNVISMTSEQVAMMPMTHLPDNFVSGKKKGERKELRESFITNRTTFPGQEYLHNTFLGKVVNFKPKGVGIVGDEEKAKAALYYMGQVTTFNTHLDNLMGDYLQTTGGTKRKKKTFLFGAFVQPGDFLESLYGTEFAETQQSLLTTEDDTESFYLEGVPTGKYAITSNGSEATALADVLNDGKTGHGFNLLQEFGSLKGAITAKNPQKEQVEVMKKYMQDFGQKAIFRNQNFMDLPDLVRLINIDETRAIRDKGRKKGILMYEASVLLTNEATADFTRATRGKPGLHVSVKRDFFEVWKPVIRDIANAKNLSPKDKQTITEWYGFKTWKDLEDQQKTLPYHHVRSLIDEVNERTVRHHLPAAN